MYDLKRMLVCLDQSEIDQTLIKAAAEYGNMGQVTDIYFVTVVKSLELPDDLKEEFPDLQKPLDEKIEQQMRERIDKAFSGVDCRFHFDVLEGDPTKQIIHWSRVKEVDSGSLLGIVCCPGGQAASCAHPAADRLFGSIASGLSGGRAYWQSCEGPYHLPAYLLGTYRLSYHRQNLRGVCRHYAS